MMSFLVRRTAWALFSLWMVLSATFAMAFVVPADPARTVAGPHASADVVARIRTELHLDEPLPMQYAHYMAGVLHGDLGKSYRTRESVTSAIGRTLPYTALLALGASIVQLLIGVPVGVISALRQGQRTDRIAMALGLVGISAPTFLTGIALLVGLGFYADWFPLGGAGTGVFGLLRSAVLPSLTLGFAGAAYYARLTRSEYLDVARRDYMRTAVAKGLHGGAVVIKHGLRNALLPVVTFFGVDLGTLLGGAVVTESVFAWPGIGKLAIDSVMNQDIPLMLGTVLVASAAVVASNLAVDIAYAFLDPRIRLE